MEKIAKGGSGVIFRANVVEFNQIKFNAKYGLESNFSDHILPG